MNLLHEFITLINTELEKNNIATSCLEIILIKLNKLFHIIGLKFDDTDTKDQQFLDKIIEIRDEVRKNKLYNLSDKIRDNIIPSLGYKLQDTQKGSKFIKI